VAEQEQLDFRAALAAATGLEDAGERLARLTSLASRDLSYVQTIQLDKALLATSESTTRSHQRVRVAMLGAATLEHLFPAVRVAGLRHRLLIELRAGGFGQYRQELLGADSPLTAMRPDAVLLSLTGPGVFGEVDTAVPKAASQTLIDDAVAGIRELWRAARSRFNAMVIQQSLLDTSEPLFGNHEQLISGAMTRLVSRLNVDLADAAADESALWLDIARASARDGLDSWFDIRHWLQGKMEIAPTAAGRYAELLARLLGAHFGRSRKCLVLDLDNTLWGGVIGDDGMTGIRLGEGSAAGEAHLALQKYAKKLKDRGVILAVCSKNEAAIAQEVFDRHPEMHLRRGDIAAFAVNWNDKAENLRSIAAKLNIGLDSLVFIDDNPAERARIRESLPMVAVPELPDDPALYVRTIARAGYFEATVVTEEDRLRAEQYAANTERDTLRDSA
jgi:HAD superfamily phosphatase (TIGR01681 family)